VVEQPIRNRQVASSTLALGSKFSITYGFITAGNAVGSIGSP
jgi:hypothetical protein